MARVILVTLLTWFQNYLFTPFFTGLGPMGLGLEIGLIYGDPRTGIILGGSIQAMFLGVMNVGGSLPADSGVTTIIVTAFVIESGASIETGLAIAYPLGTIAGQIYMLTTPLFSAFDVFYDHLVYDYGGDLKKFDLFHLLGLIYGVISTPICVFVALTVGSEVFIAALNKIPANIMTGINMAGTMMVAIGLGLVLQMIWSVELGGFFFIGFYLAAYAHMNSVQIGIIGLGLALFYYSILSRSAPAVEKNEEQAIDGGEFF